MRPNLRATSVVTMHVVTVHRMALRRHLVASRVHKVGSIVCVVLSSWDRHAWRGSRSQFLLVILQRNAVVVELAILLKQLLFDRGWSGCQFLDSHRSLLLSRLLVLCLLIFLCLNHDVLAYLRVAVYLLVVLESCCWTGFLSISLVLLRILDCVRFNTFRRIR